MKTPLIGAGDLVDDPAMPLVSCPAAFVGCETDMRWVMMTAVIHRQREARVTAARRVIRSRSGHISKRQRALMHAIIDGSGDLILQKSAAFGLPPE